MKSVVYMIGVRLNETLIYNFRKLAWPITLPWLLCTYSDSGYIPIQLDLSVARIVILCYIVAIWTWSFIYELLRSINAVC